MAALGFGERADGEIDVRQWVLKATRKPVSRIGVTCRVELEGHVADDAEANAMARARGKE
jgi:hypothetical protein